MGAVIHVFGMPPFIVTLAGMFLARGASFLMSTESTPIISAGLFDGVGFRAAAARGRPAHAIALIMLAVVAAGAVLLHFTRFAPTSMRSAAAARPRP